MSNMILAQNQSLTMSSLEIAELTGKQHKHVLDDIRKLCFSLEINSADFSAQYKDNSGKSNKLFNLPKRECLILISGYNARLRAAIIDRWQELESNQQLQVPKTYAESLQLAADQAKQLELAAEKLEEADQEVQRLQGVCHNIAAQFSPGMTAACFCRQLNGVNIQQVQAALVKRGILYRQKKNFRVTAYYRDKWFTERHETPKEGVNSVKVLLTREGAISLYKLYLKHELPMKKDWDNNFSHILFDQSE